MVVTVQKSVSTSLVFTSADGRGVVEIGSQVDFGYDLGNGSRAVVSLPLTALGTLEGVFAAIVADADVQSLIDAATPVEPEPVEPPVDPEVEP